MDFPKLLTVEARPNYRLYLSYADGVAGEVDLSASVNGGGVFSSLRGEDVFATVRLVRGGRAIEWDGDIDICPNSAYLDLTGQSYEEWASKQEPTHA